MKINKFYTKIYLFNNPVRLLELLFKIMQIKITLSMYRFN